MSSPADVNILFRLLQTFWLYCVQSVRTDLFTITLMLEQCRLRMYENHLPLTRPPEIDAVSVLESAAAKANLCRRQRI